MPQIVFTPGNIFEVRSATSGPQNVARKALYYNNERANLAGIFALTAWLDGTDENGEFKDYDFTHIMARHRAARNNFFRHYLTNYWLYNPATPTPTGEDPRKRYSPFLWLPGQKKWDLTRYNEDYFGRLRAMLAAARDALIYVQIVLFDCAGMRFANRWPLNPWNASRDDKDEPNNINGVVDQKNAAGRDFYVRDLPARDSSGNPTTLGAIQDAFIKKTLETSLEFGNVMFEIMNEPTGGRTPLRAQWADAIVGTINGFTKGRRLIFYNDHTFDLTPEGGVDVNTWKDLELPNYDALDGVIFHGTPNDDEPNQINPDTRGTWRFRSEKLIQLSSDTVIEVIREKKDWNTKATNKCFQRLMLFQSEASSDQALAGVRAATPQPSVITPFRALGVWDKTSTAGPHFNVRFDANGRFTAFDAKTDKIQIQGRLTQFDANSFTTLPDGQTASMKFLYSVSAQRLSYRLDSEGSALLGFDRFPVDLEPFVFGWEKIGEDGESERSHYFLYFKKKNGVPSFSARDQPAATPFDEGTVTAISSFPPQITLQSALGVNVFAYSITNNGKNLVLIGPNRRQDFKRVI